jgi:hypothetical protein
MPQVSNPGLLGSQTAPEQAAGLTFPQSSLQLVGSTQADQQERSGCPQVSWHATPHARPLHSAGSKFPQSSRQTVAVEQVVGTQQHLSA